MHSTLGYKYVLLYYSNILVIWAGEKFHWEMWLDVSLNGEVAIITTDRDSGYDQWQPQTTVLMVNSFKYGNNLYKLRWSSETPNNDSTVDNLSFQSPPLPWYEYRLQLVNF